MTHYLCYCVVSTICRLKSICSSLVSLVGIVSVLVLVLVTLVRGGVPSNHPFISVLPTSTGVIGFGMILHSSSEYEALTVVIVLTLTTDESH